MPKRFAINLLRMIAAETHLQSTLAVARDMFGRNYFALGVGERTAVDQAVMGHLGSYYTAITPEYLEGQQAKIPMGFPIQAQQTTPESSPDTKAS